MDFEQVRKKLKVAGERRNVVRKSIHEAPEEGFLFEFGVKEGLSLDWISRDRPNQQAFGFDTFTGLPEDWIINSQNTMQRGRLKPKKMVELADNVTLVKGLFQNTLEGWMEEFSDSAAFVHIDCDLYNATKYVLSTLNERIKPGTVILFDDLYRWGRENQPNFYSKWEEGEWKALLEWLDECDRVVEPLYRCEDRDHWSASFIVVQ